MPDGMDHIPDGMDHMPDRIDHMPGGIDHMRNGIICPVGSSLIIVGLNYEWWD